MGDTAGASVRLKLGCTMGTLKGIGVIASILVGVSVGATVGAKVGTLIGGSESKLVIMPSSTSILTALRYSTKNSSMDCA